MNKKNIKVKKSKGDISITIENNLNANNKQINHQPIKRRRRKKKIENNEEIDTTLPTIPLKDISYMKPGPISTFQKWRNNMIPPVVLPPAPPAPPPPPAVAPALPALPAPSIPLAFPAPPPPPLDVPNWKDFAMMMALGRVKPPETWTDNLVDNNDDVQSPIIVELEPSFEDINTVLNTLTIEDNKKEQIKDQIQNELKISNQNINQIVENLPIDNNIKEDIKTTLNKTQAKKLGTLHGNKRMDPTGPYKDTVEYQTSYNIALKKTIPGPGRTRLQKQNDAPSWKEYSMLMQSVDKIKDDIYNTQIRTPKPPISWTDNLVDEQDDEEDLNDFLNLKKAANFKKELQEKSKISESLKKKVEEKEQEIQEEEQEIQEEELQEPKQEQEQEQEEKFYFFESDSDEKQENVPEPEIPEAAIQYLKNWNKTAKKMGTQHARQGKKPEGDYAIGEAYQKAYYIQLGKQDAARSERPQFDNTDYQEGYEQEIRRIRNPSTKKEKKIKK